MPPAAPGPSAPAAPSTQQQQQQQRQSLRIGKRHDPHDDDLPWSRQQTDAPSPDPAPERARTAPDAR